MAEQRNGKIPLFLASCLWAVVIAFSGACVGGYLILDKKIVYASEKSEEKAEKVRKEIKDDLKDIQKAIQDLKQSTDEKVTALLVQQTTIAVVLQRIEKRVE